MILTPITASHFRSDGGAMFGLVPKTIWDARIPANEKNTIAQNANAILFELPDGKKGILETGCGDPAGFGERSRLQHGMPDEPWPLLTQLETHGWSTDDISYVIFSHLHWDHAGGAFRDAAGTLTFPQAEYFIHQQEWTDAHSGDVLLHKSYPTSLVEQLRAIPESRIRFIHGASEEILPGIFMEQVGGHTRGLCVVRFAAEQLILRRNGEDDQLFENGQAVFTSDACPTQHHFRLVFQTSYDVFPLDTRRWKHRFLPQYAENGTVLLFGHDPDIYGGTIRQDGPDKFSMTMTIPVSS